MFFGLFITLVIIRLRLAGQAHITAHHINKRHALVFGERTHQPFVDSIEHHQYFHTSVLKDLKVWAAAGGFIRFGTNVINAFLIFLLARQVIFQAHIFDVTFPGCGGKPQQLHDRSSVGKVLTGTFFDDFTEFVPKRLILLWLFLRHGFQHAQHTLCHSVADRGNAFVLLQNFSRHVQRQVVGIDNTFDETQIQGQKLIRIVHDKDALDVEFQTFRHFPVVQIKRRAFGQIDQTRVFELAFHPIVTPAQWVFKIVGDMLIELLVFLVLHFRTRASPQCLGRVNTFQFRHKLFVFRCTVTRLRIHPHRYTNMIGISRHNVTQAGVFGVLQSIFLQMQNDLGPSG